MKKIWTIFIISLIAQLAFAQLTIKVLSLPANTPLSDTIFIAGTFNNWNSGSPAYTLARQPDGSQQITINPPIGRVEFKFTRGDWARVEGDAQGKQLPNRVAQYNGQPQTIETTIASWEDPNRADGQASTAAANVSVLSQNFFMPQLNRSRRVWLYLPPDYNTSNKRYPVLYMHDGQNLFDNKTSFSGEWQVDESLNRIFDQTGSGLIVVGIDNGGSHRLDEYSPWRNASYGGGEGAAYDRFIVETLKPYIDANFRTRPERDYTGIMGSSMGGLISLYSAIEHQDIFGKVGIFSPAFWFAPELFTEVENIRKHTNLKIYMLAGEQEDDGEMLTNFYAMYRTLREVGFTGNEIYALTEPDGQHAEWFWAREFPAADRWLFVNNVAETPRHLKASVSSQVTKNYIKVNGISDLKNAEYRLIGKGQLPTQQFIKLPTNGKINLKKLQSGNYTFLLYNDRQLIDSKKISKK